MSSLPDHIAYGTPAAYRHDIAQDAWSVGIYAEQIQRYCELGDDAGLAYAVRCLIGGTRAIAGTTAELKALTAKQAERKSRSEVGA
jgi:hypothetical protein